MTDDKHSDAQSSGRSIDTIADIMIREMFAPHELPLDEELTGKYQAIAAKIDAALAPQPGLEPTDGFVLMPVEATREMTMAGCDSLPACEHVFGYAGEMLRNAYRKMVEVGSRR